MSLPQTRAARLNANADRGRALGAPASSRLVRRHLAGKNSDAGSDFAGWKPAFRPARCRRSYFFTALEARRPEHEPQIDLSGIDPDGGAAGDQAFTLSAARTPFQEGEIVMQTFASSTTLSIYVNADNVADMTIHVLHQPGLVMDAGDFVL